MKRTYQALVNITVDTENDTPMPLKRIQDIAQYVVATNVSDNGFSNGDGMAKITGASIDWDMLTELERS